MGNNTVTKYQTILGKKEAKMLLKRIEILFPGNSLIYLSKIH